MVFSWSLVELNLVGNQWSMTVGCNTIKMLKLLIVV